MVYYLGWRHYLLCGWNLCWNGGMERVWLKRILTIIEAAYGGMIYSNDIRNPASRRLSLQLAFFYFVSSCNSNYKPRHRLAFAILRLLKNKII